MDLFVLDQVIQAIEAAHQRALAGVRRAKDDHDLVGRNI
jgi:hypothetical protein